MDWNAEKKLIKQAQQDPRLLERLYRIHLPMLESAVRITRHRFKGTGAKAPTEFDDLLQDASVIWFKVIPILNVDGFEELQVKSYLKRAIYANLRRSSKSVFKAVENSINYEGYLEEHSEIACDHTCLVEELSLSRAIEKLPTKISDTHQQTLLALVGGGGRTPETRSMRSKHKRIITQALKEANA